MAKTLALELLESLYNELMKRAKEGVYSGEVLEKCACTVLTKLHASKDPFCIYRQELSSQSDWKRRSNNPLDHVIRRLTEEIFAITTTNSYPVLLTPRLYVICVSLLSELSFGRLSALFLDTYDGYADKFEDDFKPLMLEMFARRTSWWVLVKNLEYLVGSVGSGVSGAMSSDRVRLEFEELGSTAGLVDFLPLAFAGFGSLRKGISEGRYSLGVSSGGDRGKVRSRRGPGLGGFGAIIEKARIVETLRSLKKSERAVSSERQDWVLDTFALARVSIAAVFKVLSGFGVESGRRGPAELLGSGFKCMVEDFKASVATLLAGSEIFDLSARQGKSGSKADPDPQQVFELDGSVSSDIFTLGNKASTYFPFHFLHIQAASGLRSLVRSLGRLEGSDWEPEGCSGLYDLVVAYLMRMFNQIEAVLESRGSEPASHESPDSPHSVSRFDRHTELIASEAVLLAGEMMTRYGPCRPVFRKRLLGLCVSQLRGGSKRQRVSSLFLTTFAQLLQEGGAGEDLEADFLADSWDRIFREVVFPGLLDSYKVDLFVSMISSGGAIRSLSRLNMEAFLGKYFGVFSRVLAYHPDLAAKPVIIFVMSCINVLKGQMPGFRWLASWTKIILGVICTPLMAFFPQKVNCSIQDIKAAVTPIKPNNRILSHLSALAYPRIIHAEGRRRGGRPDLKSIISDLPTNLLLVSIYSSSHHAGSKRLHVLAVLSACNRFIDLLVADLVGSLEEYRRQAEEEAFLSSPEKKSIARLACEILQMFPFLFHQGAKHSQEIYEKMVKVLVFLITEFDELMFQEEVFEAVLSSLRLELHSNVVIISPVCWAIGEVFVSRVGSRLLDDHEPKVLKLIDSLERLLEDCCLRCTQAYDELSRKSCDSEADAESNSNSGVPDETDSDCSNSSYSSFISDSSVEIDHVVSEDGFEESLDHFMSAGGGEFASGGLGGLGRPRAATTTCHSSHFANPEYATEGPGKSTADLLDEDLRDETRYLDNVYLLETIVSTLCKIGLSCKQSKPHVMKLIEACSRKLQVGSFETDSLPGEQHLFVQQDQLIQYSRFILSKKVSICLKSLSQSSMFSSALHKSMDLLPSTLHVHGNKSLGSILL